MRGEVSGIEDVKFFFRVPRSNRFSLTSQIRHATFSNMKGLRVPVRSDRGAGIVEKCHPAIFEVAGLVRECGAGWSSVGPACPAGLAASIKERFQDGMERIRRYYPDVDGERFIACVIFGTGNLGDAPGWPWEADLIHFIRYGVALRVDLKKRGSVIGVLGIES
jgi:hypothetical protein